MAFTVKGDEWIDRRLRIIPTKENLKTPLALEGCRSVIPAIETKGQHLEYILLGDQSLKLKWRHLPKGTEIINKTNINYNGSYYNNSLAYKKDHMATNKTASNTAAKKATSTSTKPEENEFQEFFVDELKDIYWAEKHLVKALPKMQKASTSPELAAAFQKHTQETQMHIETLEQVFSLFEEKAVAKKCDAMAGLLEEATGIIEDTDAGTMIRDAGLILAAQKVEHYEIATYGTLVVFARTMGRDDVAELLAQTLENEKATDVALTTVAESFINEQAAAE